MLKTFYKIERKKPVLQKFNVFFSKICFIAFWGLSVHGESKTTTKLLCEKTYKAQKLYVHVPNYVPPSFFFFFFFFFFLLLLERVRRPPHAEGPPCFRCGAHGVVGGHSRILRRNRTGWASGRAWPRRL
jgi:hypothetical protein